jgi:hypothetical protein
VGFWRYGSLDLFYDKFGFFIYQQHAFLLLMTTISDWDGKILITRVQHVSVPCGLFLHVTMTTLCSFL